LKNYFANSLTYITIGLMGVFMSLSAKPIIVLETNQGSIELELKPEFAPKACENFEKLVRKGYYNGVIFHRVIPNFMIQSGDPTGTGRGGESAFGRAFPDECTSKILFQKKGLLAMANSGPNTNGSQFFITTVPTSWLNGKHTIFGEVISGYEAVTKIETIRTRNDKPIEDQKIIRAYVKE